MSLNYASKLFWRRSPLDRKKKLSHSLMLANGMISPICKGQFSFLPLGYRVLSKLKQVVEVELNKIGALKFSMPFMAPSSMWKRSGRWDSYGSVIFKLMDRDGSEFCLQPTAEEMVSDIVGHYGTISSNSLPLMLYQSTSKFRNEERPEFGTIRSTQFLMNDLYSFDCDLESASRTYKVVAEAYRKIFFDRLGLIETYVVDADNGDMGGDVSHEYHLPNEAAQDHIGKCPNCHTTKLWSSNITCQACNNVLKKVPTVEVAHTFMLGTRYSHVFRARNEHGSPYFMNCFGIGLTRLIAASIDILSVGGVMRLPYPLNVFKMAIILPKPTGDITPPLDFFCSVLNDMNGFKNVEGDILIEDRIHKTVGQRLRELNQLGIPHIFVVQAKKSFLPHDLVKIEYFRTEPRSSKLVASGILNHSQMCNVIRNID